MSRNKIYGMLMRPCSFTLEDNKRVMMSTEVSVSEGFYKAYSKHMASMEIVAECAKVYIEENWREVRDWSGLDVIIKDNTWGETEYFNYENNKLTRKRV